MTLVTPHPPGAERRREKRYEVELEGALGIDGEVHSVKIADLSASGAMIVMPQPPQQGVIGDLWIAGFGDLEIRTMFCGDGVCGVMFTHPAPHRDRLLKWLTQDVLDATAPA